MKKSDHHVSMCPLNTDPESMTQRRLASMKHKGHPSVEGRGGPRENLPAEAENRSRSPPLEPNKHIAKDAQGPQKEISSGRRARTQRRSRKRKAAPSPPTPPKKGTPALEMGEIMEIKGDLAVSPNSEAKEPFKRRLVSYADQVEETHEGNSRVTGHQLFELTSRKTNTSAREIRRSLTVSPNLEVKELFKRRLVSYDNEADEKHESNSHVNDQRKRKASPSPPTSRKKGTPALEMGEIRGVKKTRSDLMVSQGLEAEEPFKRRLVPSGDEADEKHESNSCVSRQLFEPAVLELIRVESAKTDLVQVDTPSNPFSAFSLRDQGGVFQVNETANQPRPRAADFYDPCDDAEQLVKSVETEMPADIEAAGNHERVPGLVQEMAEHGPETAVVASPSDAACPTMLTTGSFQSEQSPIADARMEGSEAGIIIQPTNDGLLPARSVARESVTTAMTEEPDQVVETGDFPGQFVAPKVIDAVETETLFPSPIDEPAMEVDVTTTAAEKLSATFGEPVKVVAGPDVDTEMAEGQLSFDFEEPAVACDCNM